MSTFRNFETFLSLVRRCYISHALHIFLLYLVDNKHNYPRVNDTLKIQLRYCFCGTTRRTSVGEKVPGDETVDKVALLSQYRLVTNATLQNATDKSTAKEACLSEQHGGLDKTELTYSEKHIQLNCMAGA